MSTLTQNNSSAQMDGTPKRSYYTGSDLSRALDIDDLRARTHKRMPRFVLEYLEGGAGQEETLTRERAAFGEWLFMPRMRDGRDRRAKHKRSKP